MRKFPWFLIGLIFAGLIAAEAVAAQGVSNSPQSPPTTQRQRAPGVPMAPNASEAQKATPQGERSDAASERDRLARNRSAPPEPNREVPMPKPVPSIIAP